MSDYIGAPKAVFSLHHANRPTVTPVLLTVDEYTRTVYAGELVWFTPRVTGGKVAARLIHIDLEKKECELEITATGSKLYRRGTREFHVPFTKVFKRNVSRSYWPTPRFSLRWLDYPTAKERAGAEWQRLSALVAAQ